MNIEYMKLAILESDKAEIKNSAPIGAVIIKNNKIISRAHNINYRTKNITDHAEIICIKKASKKLKDWRLNDCEMYVTLEPCNMCKEVIRASRIKKVYYISKNKSSVCDLQTEFIKQNFDNKLLENINNKKLKNFFKKLR